MVTIIPSLKGEKSLDEIGNVSGSVVSSGKSFKRENLLSGFSNQYLLDPSTCLWQAITLHWPLPFEKHFLEDYQVKSKYVCLCKIG